MSGPLLKFSHSLQNADTILQIVLVNVDGKSGHDQVTVLSAHLYISIHSSVGSCKSATWQAPPIKCATRNDNVLIYAHKRAPKQYSLPSANPILSEFLF